MVKRKQLTQDESLSAFEAVRSVPVRLVSVDIQEALKLAQQEEVEIHRRDGAAFSLAAKKKKRKSPFDVRGIQAKATTQDILRTVRESRMG